VNKILARRVGRGRIWLLKAISVFGEKANNRGTKKRWKKISMI
jgi:hypothetical protein